MTRAPAVDLVADAVAALTAAGVETPRADARLLLAHALEIAPGQLIMAPELDQAARERFTVLVQRRAQRVPLQHLTGRASFRHLELAVGPGVFVPRPETEVMTGWAIDRLRPLVEAGRTPVVVDLGAGSGAIAKSVATELPGTVVHAVERSPDAAAWAQLNLSGTGVDLLVADMTEAPADWDGSIDLVIANPPYIPLDAYESVAPEARDHDPATALFSGGDGLEAIRVVVATAARLLGSDGLLCFEHADVQGESAPAVVIADGSFRTVRDHPDLTGRPRFVTAVRRTGSRAVAG